MLFYLILRGSNMMDEVSSENSSNWWHAVMHGGSDRLLTVTEQEELFYLVPKEQLKVLSSRYLLDLTALTLHDTRKILIGIAADLQVNNFRTIVPVIVSACDKINFTADLASNVVTLSQGEILQIFLLHVVKLNAYLPEAHEVNFVEDMAKLRQLCDCYACIRQETSVDEKRFASSEFVCHNLPYLNLTNGSLVPMLNFRGKKEIGQVHILKQSRGLVLYALTPYDAFDSVPEIKILFRGTHDINSAIIDLEKGAPGYETFKQEELSILIALCSLINKVKVAYAVDKVMIYTGGHSLGGALAQNFSTSLMRAMVSKMADNENSLFYELENALHEHYEDKYELRKIINATCSKFNTDKVKLSCLDMQALQSISGIETACFNAAGIARKVAKRSIGCASYLAKRGVVFKHDDLKVIGDAVQLSGGAHFLYDVPVSIAKVTCKIFDYGFKGLNFDYKKQAHVIFNYNQQEIPKHKTLTNENGETKAILAAKSIVMSAIIVMLRALAAKPVLSFSSLRETPPMLKQISTSRDDVLQEHAFERLHIPMPHVSKFKGFGLTIINRANTGKSRIVNTVASGAGKIIIAFTKINRYAYDKTAPMLKKIAPKKFFAR